MRSTVINFSSLGGNLGKKETDLNERIAEKEREGWEVVDEHITRPSFVQGPPVIILRLPRDSN